MKVFDLRCAHDHTFEGWFGSEDDFVSQQDRGLVTCPICGDTAVTRLPSAPRLNLSGATARKPAVGTDDPARTKQQLQALWMKAVRRVLANTEDVGDRFAEEARRIHYDEAPERSIRGSATLEETQALAEEGIEVMPLPLPEGLKDTLQ
ncbi:hypothetical protein PTE30175_02770 [Pandoraea terrae]|uniref:Uncharacterized protein n=1 Tax=Pandoraea terrae TaxID=1537710 RepID=A0A5E4VTN6_9BURK|nr:DUF1178 family protein [Pandoraea terrae]VVE15343.1 hypothetical protein PTE30175_02770 [Pandoraea terrae]